MIYTRDSEEPFQVPRRVYKERPGVVLFCIDFRKLEEFIAYKERENKANDTQMLFLGNSRCLICRYELCSWRRGNGPGHLLFGGLR